MAADALSDLLKTVRLTGAAFFDVAAREPWVAESPPRDKVLPKILPGADHLIAYHVVTMGRCFASLIGGQPLTLEPGGRRLRQWRSACHVEQPGLRADPIAPVALNAATADRLPFFINYGGNGPVSATCLRLPRLRCATV